MNIVKAYTYTGKHRKVVKPAPEVNTEFAKDFLERSLGLRRGLDGTVEVVASHVV